MGPGERQPRHTRSPYYQNLYDPHADYASCYFDAKNLVSAYATYALPIGKGKAIGNNMNSVRQCGCGRLAGFHASSPFTAGFPLAVYNATDTSDTNSRGPRPNCDADTDASVRSPAERYQAERSRDISA